MKIRATFEEWILPYGIGKNPQGPFQIEICEDQMLKSKNLRAYLLPTRQKMSEPFPKSKVDNLKREINSIFEKQTQPWAEFKG